ncbi:hypothetical protein [Ruania alba]|uniref:hypothetical protein n=1 Tax=Ruania alba TaxID=648782 RepID=UPI0015873212|nr:hypothetical protein [Ruania alba]
MIEIDDGGRSPRAFGLAACNACDQLTVPGATDAWLPSRRYVERTPLAGRHC